MRDETVAGEIGRGVLCEIVLVEQGHLQWPLAPRRARRSAIARGCCGCRAAFIGLAAYLVLIVMHVTLDSEVGAIHFALAVDFAILS